MASGSGVRVVGSVCLLMIASATAERAQVFKSGVAMVALSVTVTDGRGGTVTGLSATDFAVYEDGVQQELSVFGSDQVPLDVGLLLDSSSSMSPLLPMVKQGARDLVSRLRPGDRATLIDIKQRIQVRQDLTEDLASVSAAIDHVGASGTTALYDGLYLSLRQFRRERQVHPELRRQALVVFSDGIDTASHLGFENIAELARSADVAIYTIMPDNHETLGGPHLDRWQSASWEMRSLTRDTGGLAFFPVKATELAKIYDTITRELVNQYAMAYLVPRPEDTRSFRRVLIRLVAPAKGVARTRAGYAATPDEGSAISTVGPQ